MKQILKMLACLVVAFTLALPAMAYQPGIELLVMDHCQDHSLVTTGVMHEGYWSTALGLQGWPAAGEETIVARVNRFDGRGRWQDPPSATSRLDPWGRARG